MVYERQKRKFFAHECLHFTDLHYTIADAAYSPHTHYHPIRRSTQPKHT